ncbi:MAG: histidinol-phosphatase [Nitrospirota bacterium]|nr:histidinol-phosphatase [Nitrospirota bacterium]MDH5698789.1 histidinol-phosphatase [Nitrospirota bacterium]
MEKNINEDLMALFLSMAGLLASRGENPYKVKAYRRAADSLKSLQEDVTGLANRGELQTIPGIGKELSTKIQEFLSTGRIRAYEELKAPLPDSAREWVTLPGFSEPIVHDLVFRLGITTWEDLEVLARSHLLQTLPGLGSRGEEILAAIQKKRAACQES